MTDTLIYGTIIWAIIIVFLYKITGFTEIKNCYKLWFSINYWTNYNIIEIASWSAKGFIIVPGLIWGYQYKWLYVVTLITSSTLIWASNKKLLPTLVGFNTLWVWISIINLLK